MLYIGDSLTDKFVLAAAFFFLRILCFPIEQTAKNPDTTPTPASWAIQKMQQYFPMNVNFMLNLSPNEKGKLDKNLEEEFARVGSLLSFPEPLTDPPPKTGSQENNCLKKLRSGRKPVSRSFSYFFISRALLLR